MRYDALTRSYWAKQGERVSAVLARINGQRTGNVPTGRVIPNEEALALGEGRRLNVAVMFLDISGSSSRPSYTAAEQTDNLHILNLFFSEMIKIAEDYGGFVEKNTGDGLLAYFENNAGGPPEKATVRAVACALTMMAANDYYISPILRRSLIPTLSFRISIDYGPVTIARLGAPRRFNSVVAIGTPANFASKMLAHAKPGEVVLGDQAKIQLPLEIQEQFTSLVPEPTGWTYTVTGAPYLLYRYTGRWSRLA